MVKCNSRKMSSNAASNTAIALKTSFPRRLPRTGNGKRFESSWACSCDIIGLSRIESKNCQKTGLRGFAEGFHIRVKSIPIEW